MTRGRKVFEWLLTTVIFLSLWYWKFSPNICVLWLVVLLANAFWHIFSTEDKLRKLTATVDTLNDKVQELKDAMGNREER
jgi:hypothetical protein